MSLPALIWASMNSYRVMARLAMSVLDRLVLLLQALQILTGLGDQRHRDAVHHGWHAGNADSSGLQATAGIGSHGVRPSPRM